MERDSLTSPISQGWRQSTRISWLHITRSSAGSNSEETHQSKSTSPKDATLDTEEHQDEAEGEDDATEEERQDAASRDWRALLEEDLLMVSEMLQAIASATRPDITHYTGLIARHPDRPIKEV